MGDSLKRWLLIGPVLLYSIILHEMAHGYVALLNGDPTAKLAGRLTLNPLPHIDLLGSIILPIIQIVTKVPFFLAWAKPVPIDPGLFLTEPRFATLEVALAGPLTNMLLALAFTLLLRMFSAPLSGSEISRGFRGVMVYGVIINVSLMLFNFLPIPPLDGFTLVRFFFPAVDQIGLFHSFYAEILILMLLMTFVRRYLTRPMQAVTSALLNWGMGPARGEGQS